MSTSDDTRITWLGHATVLVQTAQGNKYPDRSIHRA